MSKYVSVPAIDGSSLLIEVADSPNEALNRAITPGAMSEAGISYKPSDVIELAKGNLDAVVRLVQFSCAALLRSVDELESTPEEIEMSFSVKVTGDGNFAIAKLGAEANYGFKLTWNKTPMSKERLGDRGDLSEQHIPNSGQ